MTSEDLDEFLVIVGGFAELRGKELSQAAMMLYWEAMKTWTMEDFRAASLQLLRTCEFMPLPHHFEQLRRKGNLTADEAWTIALMNCARWRDTNSCGNALIDKVVTSIGGYQVIAFADRDNALPHVQRRFLKAYEEIGDVVEARAAMPQLANHEEARAMLDKIANKIGEHMRLPSNLLKG